MSDTSDQGHEDFGSEDWFRTSDDVRQGVVSGNTFENKPVTYSVIEGKAIFEGDIVIGYLEDVEQDVEQIEGVEALSDLPARGVVISGAQFRWPRCTIPFEINHPNRQLIMDAINHWEQRSPIRFVERNAGNANNFPNFVVFEQQDGCWSFVGMRGGRQVISIGAGCGLGSAIHEIGHAAGLWHEQSREDRDQFVRIIWANIDPNQRHNFDQHIADGDDVGQYDFGSIMHYPRTAFSINGQATIEPLGGQAIGQRTGLSDGDIAASRAIYPTCFRAPQLVVDNFGYVAGGWRVERHPRFLADLTGDRRADIVGFGDAGAYVSLNNGNGTFQAPQRVVDNFGYVAGGWRVERHPRFLADLTGDGRADIVGFGDAGAYVSLNNGNGTFQAPQRVVDNFGYVAGGWRVERHPRFLADLTGDGRADIVGFGDAGAYVSLNNGNSTFQAPQRVVDNFGYVAGGWRVERHPRFLADLTGDGRADIVGFGDAGAYVSLNNGNGTFQAPQLVVDNFGYVAGGWRVERHPRFLADLTGDRRADIVGFGDAGAYVSLNNGNSTFQAPQRVVDNFGYVAGGWRVERHPRFLADLTGDGRADIVGFGDAGAYVSLNNGNGTFQGLQLVVDNFGYVAGGWRVERHPRFLADLTGDRREDIVGFGDAGVYVWLV